MTDDNARVGRFDLVKELIWNIVRIRSSMRV